METFVESYDFSGKTVIPFCTSASSGIGSSATNLAEVAGTGEWLDELSSRNALEHDNRQDEGAEFCDMGSENRRDGNRITWGCLIW